jgi:hypothetical protein
MTITSSNIATSIQIQYGSSGSNSTSKSCISFGESLNQALNSGNQTTSLQASTGNNTTSATSNTSTRSTSTPMSMAQIAQQYDVTNMSPTDMITMANQLYNSGHISAGEAIGLTAGPVLMLNSTSTGSPIHIIDGLSSDPSNPNANTNYLLEWQTKTAVDHQNGTTMDYSSDSQLTTLMNTLAKLRQTSS